MKILGYVLEDDVDTLNMIKNIFVDSDLDDRVEFEAFSNSMLFTKKLTNAIDIIILDYYVPPFTAVEMLKLIRKISEDCFVTLISGRKDVDVLQNGINYGADKYIHKNDPHFKEQLLEFTREHVRLVRKRKLKQQREEKEDSELREQCERLQKKLISNESNTGDKRLAD